MKPLFLAIVGLAVSALVLNAAEPKWYRGNTHTHSLWSDGDDFPEMIVGWYKEKGYDFIALSDHNILATTDKWMRLQDIRKRQKSLGRSAYEKYLAKYGTEWVEIRDVGGIPEVRLKKLSEYRKLFEKSGEFLIVQAEEISNSSEGKPVHINAVNIPGEEPIPAIKEGMTVREIIRENMRLAMELEKKTGQPILVHLNHPNFRWGVTADELARAVEEPFFEVYNGHPAVEHLGDATRPGNEMIWDISNAIRIKELKSPPLYGLGTDDSHNYHGGPSSSGRGWVMVKATELTGNALVEAMRKGDFYASSGVFLKDVTYDPASRKAALEIKAEEGVTYKTQWIGSRANFNLAAETDNGVGIVLAEQTGPKAEFQAPSEILYVRATVTASRKHPNPSFEGQMEQAWTQPVAWK